MPRISEHGYMRGRERLKFKGRTLERMALKALRQGLTQRDVVGVLRKYLDKLYFQHPNGRVHIYAEHVFVFSADHDDTLITVFRLPNYMARAANRISEKLHGRKSART